MEIQGKEECWFENNISEIYSNSFTFRFSDGFKLFSIINELMV